MTIRSIEIKNLLSFDRLIIDDFKDINCIVGKNNTGKSNLLKLIKYFYVKLEGGREVPPELNSKYSSFGSITIEYDTTRIRTIVTAKSGKNNTPYFKHIYNTLFGGEFNILYFSFFYSNVSTFKLTLTINSDDSLSWSTKNKNVLSVINNLYPFFEIQARHIDLYDWNKLWTLVSRLKSFSVDGLKSEDVVNFFNDKLSGGGNDYKDYVNRIKSITQTEKYSYSEQVLNYLKVGLDGHSFINDGEDLKKQSDGTNSYRYIEWFLSLMISLTRRDYICPTVYIDEPEIGLHSKLNEQLVKKIHDIYFSFEKNSNDYEIGKYATPYPKIIISTHSPNILKSVIKLFSKNHRVFHFSKPSDRTVVKKMVSQYKDHRFLNIFSDNEARLFFSEFIIFVEGETEVELFRNVKLGNKFKQLERADVYSTNDVALGGINPRFSNASIPYLVLYDLDQLIEINYVSKKVYLKVNKINLKKLTETCKYPFFGSKKYDLNKSINSIVNTINDKKIVLDKNNIHIESIGSMGYFADELVALLNYRVLNNFNYMVTLTTIEGVLISEASISLFVRWLRSELEKNVNIPNDKYASSKIAKCMQKTNMSSLDSIIISMSKLFKEDEEFYIPFGVIEKQYLKTLKANYRKLLFREALKNFPTKRDLVAAMRLIFEGKTSSLISLKGEKARNPKALDAAFAVNVDVLRSRLLPMAHLLSKTSGWVTRFLDYSIDEIEKLESSNKGDKIFSRKFPELYDILSRLQPR